MHWIAWATVLLYVFVALTLTHMPKPPAAVEVTADKYLHSIGYFIYASLIYIAAGLTFPRFRWLWLTVVLLLAGWAALDEITQAYFHRDPDVHDWMADMVGVLIAASLLSGLRWLGDRRDKSLFASR
jgi:VanZ family protein